MARLEIYKFPTKTYTRARVLMRKLRVRVLKVLISLAPACGNNQVGISSANMVSAIKLSAVNATDTFICTSRNSSVSDLALYN